MDRILEVLGIAILLPYVVLIILGYNIIINLDVIFGKIILFVISFVIVIIGMLLLYFILQKIFKNKGGVAFIICLLAVLVGMFVPTIYKGHIHNVYIAGDNTVGYVSTGWFSHREEKIEEGTKLVSTEPAAKTNYWIYGTFTDMDGDVEYDNVDKRELIYYGQMNPFGHIKTKEELNNSKSWFNIVLEIVQDKLPDFIKK